MPVGIMLQSITSYEITEWMAYYGIKSTHVQEKQVSTEEVLRARFANRIKKRKKYP
jgi:hypothetical protein